MNQYQFGVPVRLVPAAGQPVLEVYDVRVALEFLLGWPEDRQPSSYQAALDACLSATVGALSPEEARWMFIRFLREAAILSRDMPASARDLTPAQAPH